MGLAYITLIKQIILLICGRAETSFCCGVYWLLIIRKTMEKCKCCLEEETNMKNLWSVYESDGVCEIYGEMITKCFELHWEKPSDTNPEHICRSCINRLCSAYDFKKEILYSEQILRDIRKESEEMMLEETELDDDMEPEYLETEFLDDYFYDRIKNNNSDLLLEPIKKMEEEECVQTNAENISSRSSAPILFNLLNKAVTKPTLTKITKKAVHPPKSRKNPELLKCQENLDCVMKYTNVTPFRHLHGLEYCCYFCPEGYKKPSDLKQHTKQHLENNLPVVVQTGASVKLDISDLQCNICELKLNSLEIMLEHLKVKHKKQIHTVILQTVVPFRFEGDVLKCVICADRFIAFKLLNDHMNVKHYCNYLCSVCGRGFISRRTWLNHLKNHTTGEFPCQYCGKVFTTHLRRNAHQRGVHIYFSKRNKCSYCGEKFVTFEGKKNHEVKVHGATKQNHKCDVCDKSYNSQRSLRFHVRRYHLLLRPHKCTECSYAAYSRREVKFHMVRHTGVGPHKCEVCSKSFAKKWSLTVHMRTHTKDCRFKCEHCEKSFTQKCSLSAHIRIKHADE